MNSCLPLANHHAHLAYIRRTSKSSKPDKSEREKQILNTHRKFLYKSYSHIEGSYRKATKRIKTVANIWESQRPDLKLDITMIMGRIRDLRGISKININILDLSDNHISVFPEETSEYSKSMTMIKLSNNQIKKLDIPCEYSELRTISAKNNKLQKFPHAIHNFNNLTRLKLAHNKISELPDVVLNVEYLNLSYNNISDIRILEKWPLLKTLKISNNKISELPKFRVLKRLIANNNNFQGSLTFNCARQCIKEINVSYNQITDFWSTNSIWRLSLNNNNIQKIPIFPDSKQLFELNLDFNVIEEINVLPCAYSTISIAHNKITGSILIRACGYLKQLILSHNYITKFNIRLINCNNAEHTTSLIKLEKLYLNNNRIESFDKYRADVCSITVLDLKFNKLTYLNCIQFSRLSYLNISNNEITETLCVPSTLDSFVAHNNNIPNIYIYSSTAHIVIDKKTRVKYAKNDVDILRV